MNHKMKAKYLQGVSKIKIRRGMGILLAVLMIFTDGITVSASVKQDTGDQARLGAEQDSVQKKTRTTELWLKEEEMENKEEGWSWKKDKDEPLSYTLTLDNVNFQVPDNSAISLYASQGFPIRNINIVLKGENQLVSTTVLNDSNGYQCNGIYFDYYDSPTKPVVSIKGDGSLKVEGAQTGMNIPGNLKVNGVTIDARKGGISVGELSVSHSKITSDKTIYTSDLHVENSEITVSLNVKTQGESLIRSRNVDISGSRLTLTGYHDEPTYSAIGCPDNNTVNIKDSFLDVRDVEFGIRASNTGGGKISLDGVTGTLFCTDDWYHNKNSVFYCYDLDVKNSEIFTQSGENILTYGDCTLPEEIKEFTVEGDMIIQGGKTFTIGEDQKVTFTKNYPKLESSDDKQVKLINNGTLKFDYRLYFPTRACLENKGTLVAEDGLNYYNDPGFENQIDRFTNQGTYNGIVYLHSGADKYYYGNVTWNWKATDWVATLGVEHWYDPKVFVTTRAALTILDGKTLDATKNGVTGENLNQCLAVNDGGKIIVESGGSLLLPVDVTEEQLDSLNLSGRGTVKIGDLVLHKVICMDGDTILYSGFANGENMVPQPPLPAKDGYIFCGWYTEEGTAFDFNMPIDMDLTLYARWEFLPVDVALKADSSVSVKGNQSLTYGQELSKLEFNPAVFVEAGTNTEVSGILRWKNPSDIPKVGSSFVEWEFIPDNRDKYKELTGMVEIMVVKARPVVDQPPVIAQPPVVSSVSIDKEEVTLTKAGETIQLTASVEPADAGNQKVTWTSSNPQVATVDAEGKVTAVGNGTCTITVTTEDGGKTAVCKITVVEAAPEVSQPPAVSGVSIDKEEVMLTKAGETVQLTASVIPADAANQKVTWTSSNPQVATVDEGGKVTAVGDGTCTITATTEDGGKTAVCKITVVEAAPEVSQPPAVSGVSIDKEEVMLTKAGETIQLTASVEPADAGNQKVTWTSSNPQVATVDAGGKVTAVGNGTCTITATTEDGGKTAVCKITVVEATPGVSQPPAVSGVSIDKGEVTLTKAGESVQLTASVEPADAGNQKVTWTSSNPQVATVDAGGKVTAVGNGTCTITATTEDGSKTAVCKITVNFATEDIPVTPSPEIPSKKERTKNELMLNAKLKVKQTRNKIETTWGKVSGADGYDVYVQYCGKKFTKKSITSIKSGKTTKVIVVKVNGKPLNLKKNYKVYVLAYKLANGKKITLGKTITAHIVGRKNTKYTNVKAIKVKKSSYSLKRGNTATIKAKTILVSKGKKQLSDAHAKEFRYTSSNKKVAAISEKGKIKAIGKGTCTIYVYGINGYAKKVKVKVK